MRKYLLALAVLAVLPAMVMAWPGVGTKAPDFTLKDTAGVDHSLYGYSGQVKVLYFWQTG